MFKISAKPRKELGRETKELREKGIIPAVLYGPKIKNQSIELNQKEFKKIYSQAGKSSLLSLDVDGNKFSVLINEIQNNPVTEEIMHIDFYQPILTEEVKVNVLLVFEGEAPAVKDLGGTLVKEMQEIEVSALPENLPHEIKVDVSKLVTFENEIMVKDIIVPKGVKINKEPETIIAAVLPPEKIEEELEKPIEEKVEEVEEAGKKEGEEKEEEAPEPKTE